MAVGEAILFFDRRLAADFEFRCKQAGQLASKMRYLSAPWVHMLEDGTWLENARHAHASAKAFASAVVGLPGVELKYPVEANSVFCALANRSRWNSVRVSGTFIRSSAAVRDSCSPGMRCRIESTR